jgi:SAM-dependent methyltransferase
MTNDSKKFWQEHPCEAWHSRSEIGTREWSDEISNWRYFVQPHIPRFAEFGKWRGKSVLEIGTGIGTDALRFGAAGANVVAIDFSGHSIDLAKGRQRRSQIDFEMWNSAEEDLPTGKFDLIYSFGVLHHMRDPLACLKLARQRIKATGELRIMLYARWSLKFLTGQQPEAAAGCPIVKLYSARTATKLLADAGFGVIGIKKTHVFPWDVKAYREGQFIPRRLYRFMPDGVFHWLESVAGHHLLISARPI